ncbi:non-ribosomal peptide synthetase [Amycolatopsis cihanbeyliensis]|uniref:Phenyloxazoline synthase MbtB n=1 Tax=Amycolatopsis cihanbeyliensis TaxID=1128664 RepID=A0A542DBV3_AMYCI|nr:non-ribosomal peptide synthetase [Amycolatopsis cihanbeyliensis]TQJ00547.1 amino acid adenylation domain-containing protein [Amycolatopsis cihanbeyliensis]
MSLLDVTAAVADALELPPDAIGAEDNLIELGMDSITMMRLAGAWRKAGATVRFADLVATPTVAAWRDLLGGGIAEHEAPAVVSVDETAPFPLALMQHAYWVGRAPGQQLGGVAAHFYHEFDGTGVDPERLDRAVRAVLARHGMLRARVLDDGTQRILSESPWPGLRVHDLRAHPAHAARSTLDELRERLSHRGMDIGAGEVFDVQLTLLPDELRERGTRVHVNLDMVAADALSLRVLLADLATAYAGESLPPLTYSYPRYLAERASAPRDPAEREYWRRRLPELPGAPRLPAAGHVSEVDAATVTRRHRRLDPRQVRELERLARRHGLTTAMALAGVFAETLTAWSAEPRFLLNLPLFDRESRHPDVDALVGDFTSSVLLEWDGARPGTFAERAAGLQERFHTDVARAGYSGVEVLRDLSRLHGERVLAPVVYTSALGLGELFAREVRHTFGDAVWIISQGPQVWLDAQVTELDGGLLVNWDIREDAFHPGVPEAMFAAYSDLLDRLLAGERAWSEPVPPLVPAGQLAVRAAVNDTAVSRQPRRLHDGFFARTARNPGAPALLWDRDGELSYGELAARALAVAGHVRAHGAGPGDVVAVSLPKGPEQIVAVLGVLAAGAAYLPLGVDQPRARRERILRTADVRLVLDDLAEAAAADPLDAPVAGEHSALAYVLYTSGSTGDPKGVEVTHAAAMNTVADLDDRFGIGAGDRTLALSALEFDLSVYDIFGPLSVGGAVICPGERGRRDADAWAELLRRHRATVLNCVPALLDMLLTVTEPGADLPLRVVLLGGDWVTVDLPGRLAERAPGCRFVALGGTTETAIHSTVCEVATVDPQWTAVPYGTPLGNVACRVVDQLGRDRPDWVPGELWIGGAGVARGYRGEPDRTAEKFVERDGLRWYRTGDRARYTPAGVLEFLGRADAQVKVRGHRVELGEIEAALTAHPAVAHGVAVVTEHGRLGAAITATGEAAGLREFLRERLPSPMLPDTIAVLPSLPLTPNGKIDRATLRRTVTEHDGGTREEVTPPEGPVERRVAAAWADLVGAAAVGREHDFFTLGGDSLLATRLVGRLRADGLSGVSLHGLFTYPVLADFAATLTLAEPERAATLLPSDPDNRHRPFPPTDVQRAYWLGRDERFTLGGIGCHFYREYDLDGLDIARLEEAVNQLIRRHEMLRAVFDGSGDQRILPEVPWYRIEVTEDAGALRESMSHTVFDPERWPLFAIRAARCGERARLAIGVDNLILDALSILILYAELGALYADPEATLPPVDVSFRDYVLGAEPEPCALAAAQRYWTDRLPELPPAPRLPLAKDPAEVVRPRFSRRAATIEASRWAAITERAREHGLTPSAVLLAAFAEVLGRWSASAELTLNITLFDRKEVHPDINNVLGDFTSLLLVACRAGAGRSWLDRARQVQEELWGALDHRDVSTVWVLRELARVTGDPEATMPVVFTSALGVTPGGPAGDALLGAPAWGVSQTPQVWLDHQVTEVDGGIQLNWDAVDELFPAGVLDAMFEAYLRLLDWLAGAAWSAAVPDLLPGPQRAIRESVNTTGGVAPEEPLHAAFFRNAAERPDRIAVRFDGGELSYGELAQRALRVAAAVRARGAEPGDLVAVSLPKGPDQIVAVLGVLAAGCAYVPLGVDQPRARRERILRTAGVRHVLDDLAGAFGVEPLTEPVAGDPAEQAYVIFTSGSTGEPKGVEITHAAAVNTIADINERFGVGADDRVLAVSALDFDLSVYDIFGLLAAGGAVVTITEEDRRDARRWAELVARNGVTIWNTVPALLDMLLVVAENAGPLPALRLALLSGDWVGLDLPARLAEVSPGCRFVALGGATEAAIWSNVLEVDRVDPAWSSVPYGHPLRNQRFRVVDTVGRDCPDWVPGELWIGGAGVARGYRGAPELTAERFLVTGGVRWYRTGDLGRYWPDGTLEFLGRADAQVKIRGHRIELGEIEAALRDAPGVAHAVAAVTAPPDRRLVAAAVPDKSDVDTDAVAAHAESLLPEHMRPERLVVLPTLPLTANGKLDRAAVARLAEPEGPAVGAQAPRDHWEESVGALCTELLGLEAVGRTDNFFTLGGDSLRATRLIETLAQRFGVVVPLRGFFAAPTVEALARTLAERAVPAEDLEEGAV